MPVNVTIGEKAIGHRVLIHCLILLDDVWVTKQVVPTRAMHRSLVWRLHFVLLLTLFITQLFVLKLVVRASGRPVLRFAWLDVSYDL